MTWLYGSHSPTPCVLCVFACQSSLLPYFRLHLIILCIGQARWPVLASHLPTGMPVCHMHTPTAHSAWVVGDPNLSLHTCTASALPSSGTSTFDLIKSSQDSLRSLGPPPVEQQSAIKSCSRLPPVSQCCSRLALVSQCQSDAFEADCPVS